MLLEIQNLELILLDVNSLVTLRQAFHKVHEKTGGKLDILVNNAGASCVIPLLDASLDSAKELFDVNV